MWSKWKWNSRADYGWYAGNDIEKGNKKIVHQFHMIHMGCEMKTDLFRVDAYNVNRRFRHKEIGSEAERRCMCVKVLLSNVWYHHHKFQFSYPHSLLSKFRFLFDGLQKERRNYMWYAYWPRRLYGSCWYNSKTCFIFLSFLSLSLCLYHNFIFLSPLLSAWPCILPMLKRREHENVTSFYN